MVCTRASRVIPTKETLPTSNEILDPVILFRSPALGSRLSPSLRQRVNQPGEPKLATFRTPSPPLHRPST